MNGIVYSIGFTTLHLIRCCFRLRQTMGILLAQNFHPRTSNDHYNYNYICVCVLTIFSITPLQNTCLKKQKKTQELIRPQSCGILPFPPNLWWNRGFGCCSLNSAEKTLRRGTRKSHTSSSTGLAIPTKRASTFSTNCEAKTSRPLHHHGQSGWADDLFPSSADGKSMSINGKFEWNGSI